MRLETVRIKNFMGIKEATLDFDPRFNILIGDNGSGKTAILEALTIAAGSFFIGMKDVPTKGIGEKKVRYTQQQEYAYPVEIEAHGIIQGQRVRWSRERSSLKGSTTSRNASEISAIGKQMDADVREGLPVDLPLISYFSTGRLFVEAQSRSKLPGKKKASKELGSRFRGYRQSLDAKSNFKRFINWFELKEMSQIQKNETDSALHLVKQAIINAIPGCKAVYYDFNPDTNRGMTVEFHDGRALPFEFLSDGVRNFFAMMADIAHRCVLLNPWRQDKALEETKGVVLIDELDLHLHPSWQKIVVNSLLETFPNLQFIATTHSPFLIQETRANQLILLKECEVELIGSANRLSIEDIAERLQGLDNPRWSTKREKLYELGTKYYQAVAEGADTSQLKEKMSDAEKAFAEDTLFYAYLEALKAMKA
jgi:predicted ATP-binding protein involved in virulence